MKTEPSYGDLARKHLSEFNSPVNAVANLLGWIDSLERNLNEIRANLGVEVRPTLKEGMTSRINNKEDE